MLSISDSVEEEFDELISDDSDKKRFLRALSIIYALLLNTKVDTAEKIKRILKIVIPAWLVNREYGKRKRTVYLFKIKETLHEQKAVNITKDGQIVKTINVRRNSRYFTSKNRSIF